MKKLLFLFALLYSIIIYADSGIFYSDGGNLIPINESSIKMQKEILYLKFTPEGLEVSVYFEFNNPGETRNEIVGFVAPRWMSYEKEDFDPVKENRHPYINNFMVMVNNTVLPYKVTQYQGSGFSKDITGIKERDYIYYFYMSFNPGVTKLYHHYLFKGDQIKAGTSYLYRLKTGRMWAGGVIDDFELIIDASGYYLQIPEYLTEDKGPLDWQLSGIGKFNVQKGEKKSYVFIHSGLLSMQIMNFKPAYDLKIISHGFSNMFLEFHESLSDENNFSVNMYSLLNGLGSTKVERFDGLFKDLDKITLQSFINFVYACHGYMFSGSGSAEEFKQFTWYIPDPQLLASEIKFSPEEQAFLTALILERQKRQK